MNQQTQALTIAGSDSGGGAGIQADIKTMLAHGVFATSVVTAVTAQNTREVVGVFHLPVAMVESQLAAVFEDFDIHAAKTGMLASSQIVRAVADTPGIRKLDSLIVDPVMVSTGGEALLEDSAVEALRDHLLKRAFLVTPNVPEAEILAEMRIQSDDDVRKSARRIHELGCQNVLITGGHADFNRATDVLFDGQGFYSFSGRYLDTKNVHGTGCAFSAAITARLALGEPLLDAVSKAKAYVSRAIESSLVIGRGNTSVLCFPRAEKADGERALVNEPVKEDLE
jgi:hydroxymethylpyrimidine/phosphomethylpyrimidine kinase